MTDYHPDGGQLFFPLSFNGAASSSNNSSSNNKRKRREDKDKDEGAKEAPPHGFFVCLGKNTIGDDVRPEDMRAFYLPAGKGVYIHPGTWHNGFYIPKVRALLWGYQNSRVARFLVAS